MAKIMVIVAALKVADVFYTAASTLFQHLLTLLTIL